MKILGFNPSHHGSVCLLEDGELKFFIQEERIGNRIKYQPLPFKSFIKLIDSHKIDTITWATPSISYPVHNFLLNSNVTYWSELFFRFSHKEATAFNFSHSHHLTHCSHAFYNSGFKESIGIVIDGAGSMVENEPTLKEAETIFKCSYPSNFSTLYRNITQTTHFQPINLSRVYETITTHLGWSIDEAGKTMGLSSYGGPNPNIPNFFISTQSDPDVAYTYSKEGTNNQTFINEEKNPQLKLSRDPKEWHYNESKITNLEKDLAWKVQNDTQQLVGDYIEKAIQETGLKQVCCAGGYFLNCVTNYYLLKRFPDVEFYFEPIANDAGTSIGSAKLLWHQETQDTTVRPFKSLYLGPKYSKEELLNGIKKYT